TSLSNTAIKKGVMIAFCFALSVYLVAQISLSTRSQAAVIPGNTSDQSARNSGIRPCSESSGRQTGVTDPARADFNHDCSEHLKECSACHALLRERPRKTGNTTVDQAAEKKYLEVAKYPSHKACIECHSHQNFAVESIKRPTPFCGACHN